MLRCLQIATAIGILTGGITNTPPNDTTACCVLEPLLLIQIHSEKSLAYLPVLSLSSLAMARVLQGRSNCAVISQTTSLTGTSTPKNP